MTLSLPQIHERLKRFEKRGPIPAGEQASGLVSSVGTWGPRRVWPSSLVAVAVPQQQRNVAIQLYRTPVRPTCSSENVTSLPGFAALSVPVSHWLVVVVVSYISLFSKPARKQTTQLYVVSHAQQE